MTDTNSYDNIHRLFDVSHLSYTVDDLSDFLREQSPLEESSDFMYPPNHITNKIVETTPTKKHDVRKKRSFAEVQPDTDGDESDYIPSKKSNMDTKKKSDTTRKNRNKLAARKCRATQREYREQTDAWLTELQNEVTDLRSSLDALGARVKKPTNAHGGMAHGLDIEYINAVSVFKGSIVSTGHNAVSERHRML